MSVYGVAQVVIDVVGEGPESQLRYSARDYFRLRHYIPPVLLERLLPRIQRVESHHVQRSRTLSKKRGLRGLRQVVLRAPLIPVRAVVILDVIHTAAVVRHTITLLVRSRLLWTGPTSCDRVHLRNKLGVAVFFKRVLWQRSTSPHGSVHKRRHDALAVDDFLGRLPL